MRLSLQYSLRSLLLALTACVVCLGVQVNRANRQRDAIVELEDVTFGVEYDYERPSEEDPIDYSRKPRGWPWLRDAVGRDHFDTVVGLFLAGRGREISDRDLALLSHLTRLRWVMIDGPATVTAPGCDSFAHLTKRLRELNCRNMPGEALIHIATLSELRVLWFTDAEVTDSAAGSLGRLTNLHELVLDRTTIGDPALRGLGALTALTRLDLEGTRITDAGLPYLASLHSLKHLSLCDTAVTDSGLAGCLQALPDLNSLDLTRTAITDTSLPALAAMHNLKHICVARTRMTASGIARLRAALPHCGVETVRASPEGDEF